MFLLFVLLVASFTLTPFLFYSIYSYSLDNGFYQLSVAFLGILMENALVVISCLHIASIGFRYTILSSAILTIHSVIIAVETMSFSYFGTSLSSSIIRAGLSADRGLDVSKESRNFSSLCFQTILIELVILVVVYSSKVFRFIHVVKSTSMKPLVDPLHNISSMLLPLSEDKSLMDGGQSQNSRADKFSFNMLKRFREWSKGKRWLITVSVLLVLFHLLLPGFYSPVLTFTGTFIQGLHPEKEAKFVQTGPQKSFNMARNQTPSGASSGSAETSHAEDNSKMRKQPSNLLLILNESMGNYLFNTPQGQENSKWYSEIVAQNPDFYRFMNARGVSGMTETATLGILSGTLLADDIDSNNTKNFFSIPTIVSALKSAGYRADLFCSYDSHYEGRWGHFNELFAQFDNVISRTTLNEPAVNEYGMDDRKLTKLVIDHLNSVNESTPWVTVVIYNNLHHPFLVDEKTFEADDSLSRYEDDRARYMNSMKMTDEMTKSLYETIKNRGSGMLENTVITFTADHGETPGEIFSRLSNPQTKVLMVPLWFYIPKQLLSDHARSTLRLNKDRLVSNLDVLPTVMEVLGYGADLIDRSNEFKVPVITGQSLVKPVDVKRIIVGFQGLPFVTNCGYHNAYLANATDTVVFSASRKLIFGQKLVKNDVGEYEFPPFDVHEKLEMEKWRSIMKEKYGKMSSLLTSCGLQELN